MDTRTAILDEAQRLVQTRGVNGMSYDDISHAVGIRKPSVHHHFRTKADLLSAVIERYTEVFLKAVDEIERSNADGYNKLKRFVGLFEATLRQEKGRAVCLCGMLASELSTLDEDSAAGVRQFYRQTISRLAAILEAGGRDGSLTLVGGTEPTADMVFSMLEGGLMTCRVSGGLKRFRASLVPLFETLQTPR